MLHNAAIEIVKLANAAAFCALTVACLRQWRARRDSGIRWAAAAFGSLAAISLISLALHAPGVGRLSVWFIKVLLIVLLLFPYFLYRFATAFQPPTWWAALPARASTAAVIAGSLALPYLPLPGTPEPRWWLAYRIAILVQWTIVFSVVARRLWNGARHEASVARLRMRTLALAATGMNAAILLSGVARAPKAPTLILVTQLLFFVSAILFYAGLAPPRWLLGLWRRPEQAAMHTAMGALFRAESQSELAAVLLPRAVGLVGARGAALVMSSGELLGSHGLTDTPENVLRLAGTPPGTPTPGIHRVQMSIGTLLIWTSPYAPFFGQDEFTLTEALGVFADIVMERCTFADLRREAEKALVHQAVHDALTGLPNRILFMDRLTQAQSGLQRRSGALSVMFLDLDRFKLVNDTIDHIAGDSLLRAVARRLTDAVRTGDTVARFGGDEFVILAEVSGERDAIALGDRLIASLAEPFAIAGREIAMTASVGVVVTTDHEDPIHLLRNADAAMYRAKEAGRARVELFDEQARLATVDRLGLERDLRRGIQEGALVLHYQPVIRLGDGAVVGVEALVRWNHPVQGLLLPGRFIPMAEESDLIVDIGKFALQEACRQGGLWRKTLAGSEDFVVWVNVSGAQFGRMNVAAAVVRALEDSGLSPENLGLEITESVFVDHAGELCRDLAELRRLGVRVAIDDFGTGFSSLGRLRSLPADVIKVDGSFVRELGRSTEDSAIVAACVALADALGLDAVAECIETADQLAALVAENCLYGQGYFFSAALPADEATAYLLRRTPAVRATVAITPRPRVALVCDDEASARFLYGAALESAGAEVATVADGISCIEWAMKHRPDLAIVDLRMPGQDGIWTVKELRRSCPETRLVLMSADPDAESFRRAFEAGAYECLSKDDVIERLDEILVI